VRHGQSSFKVSANGLAAPTTFSKRQEHRCFRGPVGGEDAVDAQEYAIGAPGVRQWKPPRSRGGSLTFTLRPRAAPPRIARALQDQSVCSPLALGNQSVCSRSPRARAAGASPSPYVPVPRRREPPAPSETRVSALRDQSVCSRGLVVWEVCCLASVAKMEAGSNSSRVEPFMARRTEAPRSSIGRHRPRA